MPRQRLSTGIYRDDKGVLLRVHVSGAPVDRRCDAQGVPYARHYAQRGLRWLVQERARLSADVTLAATTRADADETFAADVERYLLTISSAGHRRNSQGYLQHWVRHLGDRARNSITDVDAQTAFAKITVSPATKIHLRRALINLYETLNGKSGYNPGRSISKPAKPEEVVRDLPWSDIEALFAAMQPSKAKARLMLIAYVGLPQKQIKLLRPSDLRLDRRELVVHPRRKGAGVAGQVQSLSDRAIEALQEFARLDAFGTFQNLQLVRAFHSAAKRARVTLPEGARPYDLRHSYLTEIARSGADIRDIATLGMHATLEQAARYIKGVASERATKAITSVPRFGATKSAPEVPRFGATISGQKPPISSTLVSRRAPSSGATRGRSQGQKPRSSPR